ncbi:MAG: hypothetical protein ABSH46_04530 [Bryobacteraceae bacterium]|jgi:hypothetical protein
MTIALGVLGPQAMILAADSQEGTGYAGDLKLQSSKIALEGRFYPDATGNEDRVFAITGAGNSDYLWALKRQLLDAFDACADVESCGLAMERTVFSFYERHVIPFNPQQWGDLRVELIAAVKINGECGMWRNELNAVTKCDSLAVVGKRLSWL